MAKKTTRKQAPKRSPGKKKAAVRKTSATRRVATRVARKTTAVPQRRKRPSRRLAATVGAATAAVRDSVAGAVATMAARLRWSSSESDAVAILEQEHRRVQELLEQGEATTERARKGRRELLETLTAALNAHELIEEKVLYPALQSHPQARDVVLEGYQEHHVAGLIVDGLLAVATDNEEWGAKFKVLKENIEHHIQEEERELFPAARRIFSREELRELAARMLALRPPPRPRARPRR